MIEVRIPALAHKRIAADLLRPHPFAEERVGYAFTRTAKLGDGRYLVLVCDYLPVEDAHYIDDASVGARIDSQAIVTSLEIARGRHLGSFHVHMHAHPGRPRFSKVDLRYLPGLVRPLRVLVPDQCHGGFLLSEDNFSALVWTPESAKPADACRTTVVGKPLTIFGDDDEYSP